MRINPASGDDWVARVRCRFRGRSYTRWVGASGNATEDEAMRLIRCHVAPPRATAEHRAPTIVDIEMVRMHEWRARALVAKCDTVHAKQVEHWSK